MKPIFQEIVDPIIGDCFSACLASVLELPLSRVPKFARDNPDPNQSFFPEVQTWLAKKYRMGIVAIQMEDRAGDFAGKDIRFIHGPKEQICIASVDSPNFEGRKHAVVGRVDSLGNFTLLHDPNRDGRPITTFPRVVYLLLPLNPAHLVRQTFRNPSTGPKKKTEAV